MSADSPKGKRSKKKAKRRYPNRLREHRKAAGMTQAQLAAAIGLSPTSGYISNLERGRTPLPMEHPWRLQSIAKALGVPDWHLFAVSRNSTANLSVFSDQDVRGKPAPE